ncbi:mannosyltransferase [Hyaloraphidium curvatum]|nr:mannosyltransferase [Hyaloraphidium curvatum]
MARRTGALRWPLFALAGVAALSLALHADAAGPQIDEEFRRVTCQSAVKLTHAVSGFKLHSHQINYGSGSGQQSVTGFPSADDPNSYWAVLGGLDTPCKRGEPIACGSTIRLRHVATKKYLHSHANHQSPLSSNQEVSAYEGEDAGDEWKLQCPDSAKFWVRESDVRLVHDTGRYLTALPGYKYRHPIPGQMEICGTKKTDKDTLWKAMEGIYLADITVND